MGMTFTSVALEVAHPDDDRLGMEGGGDGTDPLGQFFQKLFGR